MPFLRKRKEKKILEMLFSSHFFGIKHLKPNLCIEEHFLTHKINHDDDNNALHMDLCKDFLEDLHNYRKDLFSYVCNILRLFQ